MSAPPRSDPAVPAPDVQERWTGKSGIATVTEGYEIHRFIRDTAVAHLGELRDRRTILDFGCGRGRVIRSFVKDVDVGRLVTNGPSAPVGLWAVGKSVVSRARRYGEQRRSWGDATTRRVAPIAAKMFLDGERALERYDAGEFCFSPFDAGDDGNASAEHAVVLRPRQTHDGA